MRHKHPAKTPETAVGPHAMPVAEDCPPCRTLLGFTIVELLIALVVVGILLAILLPVLASTREKGRRTACLSNERQLGMAMMQYVADNNETFPSGKISPCDCWVSQVRPYIRDDALLHCSDDRSDLPGGGAGLVVSYGMNKNVGNSLVTSGQALYASGVSGQSLSNLTASARTVLFFEVENSGVTPTNAPHVIDGSATGDAGLDGSAYSDGQGGTLTDPTYPIGSGTGAGLPRYATGDIGGRPLNGATKNGLPIGPGSTPRHAGGADYVASDGHAVWLRPAQVSGGETPIAADCLQGTESGQPPDCVPHTMERAAGTADSRYALTFSTR